MHEEKIQMSRLIVERVRERDINISETLIAEFLKDSEMMQQCLSGCNSIKFPGTY